ncbi:methyltransferase [Obesumbacterium proteus]|uniref:DNA cytosine methyltransferase n=1 Tax=Obesumbacterium proteus TaxID=82983 RepID=UPI000621DC87|nr:DNA cytosine methyltransferase [Obesumbacterium proteus]KKI49024.1 methyltransferase [Obesumbacterium proteus]
MAAYYNEIDPYAAQWLRNLIAAGHIAAGDVDERSIEDVTPDDLRNYTQCHFFAGIGVWSYALRRAGWSDDKPVWTGSCPCQPFSAAGQGGGFDDERHLWPHFHYLIEQCRPPVVFGEQVASKDGLAWLDLVQADLEGANYAATAVDICAAGVGAPHIRQRLYWVANSDNSGQQPSARSRSRSQCTSKRNNLRGSVAISGTAPTNGFWRDADWLSCRDGKWRPVEPSTFPLANGITARVGRLRAYGNAICAEVAETFVGAYMAAQEQK